MATIAYIANQVPSPVEPYVGEEIRELRRRGVVVIPFSARLAEARLDEESYSLANETLYLQRLKFVSILKASWLCLRRFLSIKNFIWRVIARGEEPCGRRIRALLHTWLGAYFAVLLRERGVRHIHVHHGYFASWIAMVAARLLGIEFTMTLHGSDLLLHGAYLDTKLENCKCCFTVSNFNRNYILEHYPRIPSSKIRIRRLGASTSSNSSLSSSVPPRTQQPPSTLRMLSVGRLHPVKDQAFLVAACRELKRNDIPFSCAIAGEGPSRPALEWLIRQFTLDDEVHLLGHLSTQQLDAQYRSYDVVVLTSRSEGIPVVLMEAMARGVIVLAPEITGIPELIVHGQTGLLYRSGSLTDFMCKLDTIRNSPQDLDRIRERARRHVRMHFDGAKNVSAFVDTFIQGLGMSAAMAGKEAA